MSLDDTLSAIDAVLGCQQCGKSLTDSVSDDFCSEEHQVAWHRARTDVDTLKHHEDCVQGGGCVPDCSVAVLDSPSTRLGHALRHLRISYGVYPIPSYFGPRLPTGLMIQYVQTDDSGTMVRVTGY
jgi:hypothetical protein